MKQIVNRCTKKQINLTYIIPICLLAILVLIAINPAKYSVVAYKGLEVWAKVLVPSLLPFFIFTKLISSGDFLNDFTSLFAPITKKVYNCPAKSAFVFFMSIISGYPVGAKLISDLYNNNEFSKDDALKTLSFSCNSGPMFILGSVAIGMFTSKKMGIIIYFSHILGSLLNGLIYRKIKTNTCKASALNNQTCNKSNFSESVSSSISSILLIGGVICFTFVLIEAITDNFIFVKIISVFSYFGINQDILAAIFSGIFEITKGCLMLSEIPLSFNTATMLCTFIISFGGISTLLQATAFTKNIIPTKTFIRQKITHALCATLISFILLCIF